MEQYQIYNYNEKKTIIFDSTICQKTNILRNRHYIYCLQNASQILSSYFNLARTVASSRQFSAYKVGLLND